MWRPQEWGLTCVNTPQRRRVAGPSVHFWPRGPGVQSHTDRTNFERPAPSGPFEKMGLRPYAGSPWRAAARAIASTTAYDLSEAARTSCRSGPTTTPSPGYRSFTSTWSNEVDDDDADDRDISTVVMFQICYPIGVKGSQLRLQGVQDGWRDEWAHPCRGGARA
jgi:hypothetical protein